MDLHTPNPFWLVANPVASERAPLKRDITCDVAVIGAGITGALTAHVLAREGLDVAVIEKRHESMGSTCASTALLQYEIDEPLHTLREKIGSQQANEAYQACYRAIDSLEAITRLMEVDCGFSKVPSLQYVSYHKDIRLLEKEYAVRFELGFDVTLLGEKELLKRFGLHAPLALYSRQGAQVDPFRLTTGLLDSADNIRVYDTVEVVSFSSSGRMVECMTNPGPKIRARNVVIASGYESQRFIQNRIVELGTTFCFASKQMAEEPWPETALIWETKTPYLYARCLPDGRIIAGGRDSEWSSAEKRKRALPTRIRRPQDDLVKILPGIDIDIDFMWAGTFGNTKDSLGYVGGVPNTPRIYFNLGFGGERHSVQSDRGRNHSRFADW